MNKEQEINRHFETLIGKLTIENIALKVEVESLRAELSKLMSPAGESNVTE